VMNAMSRLELAEEKLSAARSGSRRAAQLTGRVAEAGASLARREWPCLDVGYWCGFSVSSLVIYS